VTLMIARAGLHPLAEFEQALKRLKLSGVATSGFVLNDLDTTRMRYRYGYSGYHYQYKYR
jgi:tyrosine-protein kinase Etk/Wzc